MTGRFPRLVLAMVLVVAAVPAVRAQVAPTAPAAPRLSSAHQGLMRILTHYRNTPYQRDAAYFVYEVYLEANHLLPRYKVVLDEQLRSGELAQPVVPSGPFLPGDIHTFRNPRAPAGTEPLFGLHLQGDRFLIVDETKKVVAEYSLKAAPWKDWLLGTRRVFSADHADYVAPVFVDGDPVAAVAPAPVVTATAEGDDAFINLLAGAAAMVCALFILQLTRGKQRPRERTAPQAAQNAPPLPSSSPSSSAPAPSSPSPPPPAPAPKPAQAAAAPEDDLVIRRIRGPEEKN